MDKQISLPGPPAKRFLSLESDLSRFFNQQRFSTTHTLIFLIGNLLLICIIIYKKTIPSLSNRRCGCLRRRHHDEIEAISDDYYEEISLKFLISEYQRAKLEKLMYLKYVEKYKTSLTKHSDRLADHSIANNIARKSFKKNYSTDHLHALNRHLKRQNDKQVAIQHKLNQLCKQMGIQEPSFEEKIR